MKESPVGRWKSWSLSRRDYQYGDNRDEVRPLVLRVAMLDDLGQPFAGKVATLVGERCNEAAWQEILRAVEYAWSSADFQARERART